VYVLSKERVKNLAIRIDQFCVLCMRLTVVGGNRQFTEVVDSCW
jgi:hypothetical protein